MGRERDLHVLMHWDGRAIASRTLNDWWKEALRYSVVDLLVELGSAPIVGEINQPGNQNRTIWPSYFVEAMTCENGRSRVSSSFSTTLP